MCIKKEKSLSDKVMVVGAMTTRGVVPLIGVRTSAKINSKYYVDNVLKRILKDTLSLLYPGEASTIFVHHNAASSHTAKFTQDYAKKLKKCTE